MDDEEETGGIQEILRQVDPRAGVDIEWVPEFLACFVVLCLLNLSLMNLV